MVLYITEIPSMENYDKERNEVHISACENCPFMRSDLFCILTGKEISDEMNLIPIDCPLRDPNFKLTRHIEER